jgi:hypothetical protein
LRAQLREEQAAMMNDSSYFSISALNENPTMSKSRARDECEEVSGVTKLAQSPREITRKIIQFPFKLATRQFQHFFFAVVVISIKSEAKRA